MTAVQWPCHRRCRRRTRPSADSTTTSCLQPLLRLSAQLGEQGLRAGLGGHRRKREKERERRSPSLLNDVFFVFFPLARRRRRAFSSKLQFSSSFACSLISSSLLAQHSNAHGNPKSLGSPRRIAPLARVRVRVIEQRLLRGCKKEKKKRAKAFDGSIDASLLSAAATMQQQKLSVVLVACASALAARRRPHLL